MRAQDLHQGKPTFASANDNARIQQVTFIRGADSTNHEDSYERDNESDLDFAQARYYGYGHGRFTSPDDFANDTHPSEPQSWNLYGYVRNNPLRYIDPTGNIIEEKGKVKTKDRNDDDKQVIKINGKNYFVPTDQIQEFNGKKYLITWEAKKVWVFADNGDKIKAYQAKGDIQLIEVKSVDKNNITLGSLLNVDKSKEAINTEVSYSDLSNATNCHGTTFAKGQVWIDNLEVGKVLTGDNYRPLGEGEKAQVNDAGLFSQDDGGGTYYAHSVRVNSVNAQGVVDVVSKGGITQKETTTPKNAWQGNRTTQLQYWTQRTKK
jgi:RHS repeat-associated protein